MTFCTECNHLASAAGIARSDVADLINKVRRSRHPVALAERLREAKRISADRQADLDAHQAACEVARAPKSGKAPKGVRQQAKKPKPKAPPRNVIDRMAVASAVGRQAAPLSLAEALTAYNAGVKAAVEANRDVTNRERRIESLVYP